MVIAPLFVALDGVAPLALPSWLLPLSLLPRWRCLDGYCPSPCWPRWCCSTGVAMMVIAPLFVALDGVAPLALPSWLLPLSLLPRWRCLDGYCPSPCWPRWCCSTGVVMMVIAPLFVSLDGVAPLGAIAVGFVVELSQTPENDPSKH